MPNTSAKERPAQGGSRGQDDAPGRTSPFSRLIGVRKRNAPRRAAAPVADAGTQFVCPEYEFTMSTNGYKSRSYDADRRDAHGPAKGIIGASGVRRRFPPGSCALPAGTSRGKMGAE